MYHQLISEQRSQIFALLQRKCPRKEIARIVGISQSTLSRELKRNSAPSASIFSSRRTTRRWNVAGVPHAMLPLLLNWCGESNNSSSKNKWLPRQISGVLKKGRHRCLTINASNNLIHADTTGELARHTRHKLKYRRRPKYKRFPMPIERAFIRVPSRRTENALGILRWIWLWTVTTTPYSQSWSVQQICSSWPNLPMGRRPSHWPKRSDVCCCPTRSTSRP